MRFGSRKSFEDATITGNWSRKSIGTQVFALIHVSRTVIALLTGDLSVGRMGNGPQKQCPASETGTIGEVRRCVRVVSLKRGRPSSVSRAGVEHADANGQHGQYGILT